MRRWWVFAGSALVALLLVWSLAHVLPSGWNWLPSFLYAVVVASGAFGSLIIRKHAEHQNRTAKEGSIERDIADSAASGTFGICLVAMVAFGLYLVLQDQFVHAFVLYLLIAGVIIAYWIRYAIVRRQLT